MWFVLAIGLVALTSVTVDIRSLLPRGPSVPVRGVPKGAVLRMPAEEVDEFYEFVDRLRSESPDFNIWKYVSFDPMPVRGGTIVRGFEDWDHGPARARAEIITSSLLRSPVPRERVEFFARRYPSYRVHSWIISLDTVYGLDNSIHKFFVKAVLETPRGHFGQSFRLKGVSIWHEYEEEWLLKGPTMRFLKSYVGDPPP